MPCRRARWNLQRMRRWKPSAGRGRNRCVTRATMPLAYAHDDLAPAASALEGRALRRQGASAWRASGVACRDRGGRRRFLARAWVVALACQKPKDLGVCAAGSIVLQQFPLTRISHTKPTIK